MLRLLQKDPRMRAYAQRDGRPRNIGGALCWEWRWAKVP